MRFLVKSGLAAFGLAASVPAMAGDPAPIGGVKLVQPVSFPVLNEFRVRIVVPPSEPNWRMLGPQSLAKHGVGGALVDYFPFDEHFHLSAGGRLFNRSAARSSDPASLQPLSSRMLGGIRPTRKFTPTMLMGYSVAGNGGLALGIDAGVMVGQSSPSPDFRMRNGGGVRAPGGMNGLARMTLRAPF